VDVLSVNGLTKRYPGFELHDISFTLEAGYIMGFIGRNGAGKTTTIKTMLDLVRPDAGEVSVLGKDYRSHQLELKPFIGLALGGVTYYPQMRLSRITDVFRRFYETWDDAAYRRYLDLFELDEHKKVEQLSQGMKVKYGLALALSHDAKLLILDEPTSGLDPVSRDDLLDVFREVIEEGGRSILFSTQITSDLDKCADFITYIRGGRLVASADSETFLASYLLVAGRKDQLSPDLERALIGYKATDLGFTGLLGAADRALAEGLEISRPDIEQVMVYHERRGPAGRGERTSEEASNAGEADE